MAGRSTLEILLEAKDKTGPVLDKAEGRLEKTQRRLNKMRGPALLAGAAVAGIGIAAIKFASDLDEAVNKAEVTFGDASGVIARFAADSATAFGISKRAANEYTGTIGTILTASGLAQDAAADMSVDIVQLAADLASFNNIELDEAINKLRSGLVGETEPLRTVGVLLSEAAVKAEAYSSGIAEVGAVLTEGEKVQARYALILEQTAVQQGDFARTSESVANATRIVKARVEDAAASLGEQLLPIAEKVIGALSKLVGWFGDLSPEVRAAILIIGGITLGLSFLVLALGPVIGLIIGMGTAMAAAAASGGLLAGVMAILGGPAGVALLIAGAAAVTVAIVKMKDSLGDATEAADPGLAEASVATATGLDTLTEAAGKAAIGVDTLIVATDKVTASQEEMNQAIRDHLLEGEAQVEAMLERADATVAQAFATEKLTEFEKKMAEARVGWAAEAERREERRLRMIERTTDALGDFQRAQQGLGSTAFIGPILRTTEALQGLAAAAIAGSSEIVTALADMSEAFVDIDTKVRDSRVGFEGWQKRVEQMAQVGAMVVVPVFQLIAEKAEEVDEAVEESIKSIVSMNKQLEIILALGWKAASDALGNRMRDLVPANVIGGEHRGAVAGIGVLQAEFRKLLEEAGTGMFKGFTESGAPLSEVDMSILAGSEGVLGSFLRDLSDPQRRLLSNVDQIFGQVVGPGTPGGVVKIVEQHITINGDNFGFEGLTEKIGEAVVELTATGALQDIQVGASPNQLAGQPA